MKRKMLVLVLAMVVAAVAIGGGTGVAVAKLNKLGAGQDEGPDRTVGSEEWENTLLIDGVTYRRNPDIETVLLLGIDNGTPVGEDDLVNNIGRSDFIVLAVLDSKNKTYKLLNISRDSMIPLDVYDKNQEYLYTYQAQLSLQYTVADTRQRGNCLTRDKVSQILYNIPIDHTVSLTMDVVPTLIDAMGGVTFTFTEDYTYVNPAFVQDTTYTLNGDQVYLYICYRDINDFGSNNSRIQRQVQMIRAIVSKLKQEGVSFGMLKEIQEIAGPALECDLSIPAMIRLSTYKMENEVYSLPGKNVAGVHDEYYLDDAGVKKVIAELFYTPEGAREPA